MVTYSSRRAEVVEVVKEKLGRKVQLSFSGGGGLENKKIPQKRTKTLCCLLLHVSISFFFFFCLDLSISGAKQS